MSIYIGNDLEDRLEALEAENASLRKYNEYHQVVHEIDHMSDLHVDSSFYKQSMKLDNYFKINKLIDFSIGQSTVLQELNKKRPKLSNSNQTQNRRRYVNFENGSHFICSFNLNNPESTVCIAFRLNSIASGNDLLLNGIIGNSINPLRAAVEKSRQCGTSSSHGGRENSTEKHQPVSEGISWEPRIVNSHTAPQKIAKKISFQVTENDMMVA